MVSALTSAPVFDPASVDRIRASDPLHWELREFLEDEAALLDEGRLKNWLDLLTEDVGYWMPVRASVHRADGDGFARRMGFFDETKKSLVFRISRILDTRSGWTEDPPTRTGHFVTNVRTYRTAKPDEFLAQSNLLLTRSRPENVEVKLLSARRHDVLRQTKEGLRLARRDIFVHQTTIDMQNLVTFL